MHAEVCAVYILKVNQTSFSAGNQAKDWENDVSSVERLHSIICSLSTLIFVHSRTLVIGVLEADSAKSGEISFHFIAWVKRKPWSSRGSSRTSVLLWDQRRWKWVFTLPLIWASSAEQGNRKRDEEVGWEKKVKKRESALRNEIPWEMWMMLILPFEKNNRLRKFTCGDQVRTQLVRILWGRN